MAPARGCRAMSEQIFGRWPAVVTSGHERPIPIFQQLARSDPSGRADVREYPLSLRNVEDLLAERGIDISHDTVRFWRNQFGPMFAAEIRKKRVARFPRAASGAPAQWHSPRPAPKCSSITEAVRRERKPSSLKSARPAAVPMLSPLISLHQTVHTGSPSRPVHRGRHRAPLAGKLFDDRRNRMSPSPRKGTKRW
jgi:hypothetical protein